MTLSTPQILFFGALGLIVGGCIMSLVILIRRPLSPFLRYLLLTLLVVEIVLLGLHLIQWPEGADFARWLTNLDDERNLGTIFAAVLWMLAALTSLALALRSHHKRWRVRYAMRFWFFAFALMFAFLALDEFFAIHEEIDRWRVYYAIGGAALVLVSALMFRFALWERKAPFVLLFIGLAVMGTSGILLEDLLYDMFCYTAPDGSPRCDSISSGTVYEEFFEMVGVTIVVAALLMFAQTFIPPERWRGVKRLIVGGAAVWGLGLTLYLWPLPALEAAVIATPVHAEYLDGDLELVGYWLSQSQAAPGDRVLAVLYWRANAPLPRNYNLSVHLLSRASENSAVESVAQADRVHMGQIPSKVWPPGMVVRKFVWLTLPDDLPTPVSYQLMARVWSGPPGNWEETVGLPVTNTDRSLMTPDSLLFASLPVLSDALLISPSSVARYRFGDLFTLTGYDLPRTARPGAGVTFTFWWRADSEVPVDYTQFVHLLNAEGEQVAGMDGPPFGGRFPTSDWPLNMAAYDQWQMTLPNDLAAGQYRVVTGLYDPATVTRLPITDAGGQPVPDSAILLGTIEVIE